MEVNMEAVRSGKGLVEHAACKRLHRLAAAVPVNKLIVELGAYCGRSTGWLYAGSQGARIVSVDPWENLAVDAVDDEYAKAEPNYRNGKYNGGGEIWTKHMEAIGARSEFLMPIQKLGHEAAEHIQDESVSLLFHDATHSHDAVVRDLTVWLPKLTRRATVALHDLGNPKFGVESGAEEVLAPAGFDWKGRERLLWRKAPHRRGLLVVHRP